MGLTLGYIDPIAFSIGPYMFVGMELLSHVVYYWVILLHKLH